MQHSWCDDSFIVNIGMDLFRISLTKMFGVFRGSLELVLWTSLWV